MENRQQKLREWILKQPYFNLNARYDGMTAWELAGMMIKAMETIEEEVPEISQFKGTMEMDSSYPLDK